MSSCIVAEDQGGIVGTVMGGHDARRGYVYHLAVSSSMRRMGIGTMLLENLEERFRSLEIRGEHILVFADNSGAIEFYKSRGIEPRTDIVIFSKSLGNKRLFFCFVCVIIEMLL